MFYFIRGRIPNERSNHSNRVLIAIYRPLLGLVLRYPKTTLGIAALLILLTVVP